MLYAPSGRLYCLDPQGKPQGAYVITPTPTSLAELLPTSDGQLVAFLESLLTYDPACRPSAKEALIKIEACKS